MSHFTVKIMKISRKKAVRKEIELERTFFNESELE